MSACRLVTEWQFAHNAFRLHAVGTVHFDDVARGPIILFDQPEPDIRAKTGGPHGRCDLSGETALHGEPPGMVAGRAGRAVKPNSANNPVRTCFGYPLKRREANAINAAVERAEFAIPHFKRIVVRRHLVAIAKQPGLDAVYQVGGARPNVIFLSGLPDKVP